VTTTDSVPVDRPIGAKRNAGVRVALAVLVTVAVGAALFFANPAQQEVDAEAAGGGVHPALGANDAPVVVLNFSDFQCSFCKRFAEETEPALISEYVDPGLVRMEWRDFPVLGAESERAALAGRAAHAQDRFWEYHEVLYANQMGVNAGGFTDDRLIALAGQAGLDVDAFADDLRTGRHVPAVQADVDHGRQLGFSGTPTFLINGRVLVGAQPIEVFRTVIDEALAEQDGR
jgi:protein-disulfide isomerase